MHLKKPNDVTQLYLFKLSVVARVPMRKAKRRSFCKKKKRKKNSPSLSAVYENKLLCERTSKIIIFAYSYRGKPFSFD